MLLRACAFVACLLVSPGMAATPIWITSGVQSTVFDGYWLQLPKNHNLTAKWPVIAWFHGAGATIEQVKWDGPAGKPFAQERFIMISFHLIGSAQFYDDMRTINSVVDSVMAKYSGDAARFYVSGFSRGGAGTWGYTARAHERIAAIMPIAAPLRGVTDYSIFRTMPVWIGHCVADGTVNISNSDNAAATIENAGGTTFVRMADARPQGTEYLQKLHLYSRYPGGTHGAAINLTLDSSQVYLWLLSHTKQAPTFTPGGYAALRAAVSPAHAMTVDIRGRRVPAAARPSLSFGNRPAVLRVTRSR